MLAEPHLTEDAFALHLLLQRSKGLVDIVVTDENLHVVFLFNQRLIGPTAKALGPDIGKPSRYPITTLYPEPESSLRMSLYSIAGNENHARKR